MDTSRRGFLKLGAMAGSGLMIPSIGKSIGNDDLDLLTAPAVYDNELLNTSYALLEQWGEGMRSLQYTQAVKGLQGGILCPACGTVHGRCGDAMLAFLLLADKKKDEKYLNAAKKVYDWTKSSHILS
jgi:hypothetical protein